MGALDVQFVDELGVVLNELEPELRLLAHQGLDELLDRFSGLWKRDARKRARLVAHGGFLELRRHHLAKTLEPASLGLLAFELGLQELVAVLVIARIDRLASVTKPVERRHGKEEPAAID